MEFLAGFFAPLATADGWAEVAVLMFLELALGVDNLVFIAITSDRLPKDKQHIGRRLGLAAAMIMRCILLCAVVWIMSINVVVFSLPFGIEGGRTRPHGASISSSCSAAPISSSRGSASYASRSMRQSTLPRTTTSLRNRARRSASPRRSSPS